MATGAKEVAVPRLRARGGRGACASGAARSNWPAAQGGRGGTRRPLSSGSRGHIGEGKLKPRVCSAPHFSL